MGFAYFLFTMKRFLPPFIFELFILSSLVIWNTEINSQVLTLYTVKITLPVIVPSSMQAWWCPPAAKQIWYNLWRLFPIPSVFIPLVNVQKCYIDTPDTWWEAVWWPNICYTCFLIPSGRLLRTKLLSRLYLPNFPRVCDFSTFRKCKCRYPC